MSLTEISLKLSKMKDVSKKEKTEILKMELMRINQHLPASVYIPFVQNSTRNYCVLHILADEARVFQTKERAPIMLTFEVFRPEEITINMKEKLNKKSLKSLQTNQPDNPYLQELSENILEDPLLGDNSSVKSKGLKGLLTKKHNRRQTEKQIKKANRRSSLEIKVEEKADKDISKKENIHMMKKYNTKQEGPAQRPPQYLSVQVEPTSKKEATATTPKSIQQYFDLPRSNYSNNRSST